MDLVSLNKAKTQLPELIERVERGEEVIITRGNTPVARLIPYAPEQPPTRLRLDEGSRHDRPGVLGTAAGRGAQAVGRGLAPCGCCSTPTLFSGGSTATRS
jgi:prevent-host-death family protein